MSIIIIFAHPKKLFMLKGIPLVSAFKQGVPKTCSFTTLSVYLHRFAVQISGTFLKVGVTAVSAPLRSFSSRLPGSGFLNILSLIKPIF